MPLGERIRELRTSLGWSSGDLARESGVSRAYLWQLETGGKDRPSLEILEKLARALGVALSEITGPDANRKTDERLPPGLKVFLDKRRSELGITESDIEVMRNVHYRGRRPKNPEDWELLYLFLRKWARE